eukprot:scaffold277_cov261-Pinguiococcus_pyrenoidosus.AAC.4
MRIGASRRGPSGEGGFHASLMSKTCLKGCHHDSEVACTVSLCKSSSGMPYRHATQRKFVYEVPPEGSFLHTIIFGRVGECWGGLGRVVAG